MSDCPRFRNSIIAAIAEANACLVVTDNEKDVAEIEVFNPTR